jgi:CheY-like chemotaxis protein
MAVLMFRLRSLICLVRTWRHASRFPPIHKFLLPQSRGLWLLSPRLPVTTFGDDARDNHGLLLAVIMAQPAISPKRILVVDDEPAVADTIRMVLAISGHQIDLAADAEAALEIFEPGKYDLVITDMSLLRMNGLELARNIRARSAQQPIILITAYAESLQADGGSLADINELVGKPFALSDLQDALNRVFAPG